MIIRIYIMTTIVWNIPHMQRCSITQLYVRDMQHCFTECVRKLEFQRGWLQVLVMHGILYVLEMCTIMWIQRGMPMRVLLNEIINIFWNLMLNFQIMNESMNLQLILLTQPIRWHKHHMRFQMHIEHLLDYIVQMEPGITMKMVRLIVISQI